MSSTLFAKELRETWWMGLMALVAAGCVVIDAMGVGLGHDWRIQWTQNRGQSPFLARDFSYAIGVTALCLGGALGLWQTMSEGMIGTWSYILHRPISRFQVIATKLFAGVVILFVSIGLPLLGYLVWALSEVHAAPFELWMTEDTLRLWMSGVVGYLATFLTGIRTARIYMSRLWPLVPALLIFEGQQEYYPWLPTVGWFLILIAAVLFLLSIFFAAEQRDYA